MKKVVLKYLSMAVLVFSLLLSLTPVSHAETSLTDPSVDSTAVTETSTTAPMEETEVGLPADPIVEPSADPAAEPVEDPAAEPVAEPLVESTAEQTAETLVEPTEEQPVSEPIMNMGLIETPTGLNAAYEDDAVLVKWDKIASGKLMGYNVLLNGVRENQQLVTDTVYRIQGLNSDSIYMVNVTAVYQSDAGEGVLLTPMNALPPAAEPPQLITGLFTVGGPGKVTLTWGPLPDENLAGYNVYVNGVQANAQPLDSPIFDAVGLFPGVMYDFQVEAVDRAGNIIGKSDHATGAPTHYLVELDRWGIKNDGTDPAGTTAGINNMLQWASEQNIHAVYLPSGMYLIDKDSQINMVANMLWELPADAIIQKETNGRELYKTIAIEYGADNVTLKGGWYKGDRETHDYSGKDNPYSAGTHEGGYGIFIEGANHAVIEGVKATHFTGDGLMIGGAAQMGSDIYAGNFESGGLNESGLPVENSGKIRTVKMYSLTKSRFIEQKYFELSNWRYASDFEIYFYNNENSFLSKTTTKVRQRIDIPAGATQMKIVINKSTAAGIYGEYWQRVQSDNTIVRDSEFAFNRRQGITVGGGNHTLIENNQIHDISGVAPMSGIDVEGGFGQNGHWNSDTTIRKNEFYHNARYDIILYDGRGADIDNNHLASKGAIGVAVSTSFAGDALIQNNHFDGTRIFAYHDAKFLNNKMNDSSTFFEGPNITIDGLDIVNGTLSTSAKSDGAINVSNVTIAITDDTKEGGLSVYGTGATSFRNVTITGQSRLRSFVGGSKAANTFDQLRVLGYNATYGLSLPGGTYTNSVFEAAEGSRFGFVGVSLPTKYVFDHVQFKTNSGSIAAVTIQAVGADVSVTNSTFDLAGNNQAVSVQTAEKFVFEHNTVNAMNITNASTELVRINDYWQRSNPCDVLEALINDNTINANMAVIGIQTQYAGTGAPAYTIEDNTLNKAVLSVKASDLSISNTTNS